MKVYSPYQKVCIWKDQLLFWKQNLKMRQDNKWNGFLRRKLTNIILFIQ